MQRLLRLVLSQVDASDFVTVSPQHEVRIVALDVVDAAIVLINTAGLFDELPHRRLHTEKYIRSVGAK